MSVAATKKQRKALNEYVRWMANEVGLRDWTLTIVYDPPCEDDAHARIECTYGRKRAKIFLHRDFFKEDRETQRHVVTHELLHAHLEGIRWAYNNLADHVSPSTFGIVWGGVKDQIEFGVDAIAEALGAKLPLPEIPKSPD